MAYVYALVVVSVVSITILAGYLLLALFGPMLRYHIVHTNPPSDPERLCHTLEVLCDSQMYDNSRIQVLTNGDAFYESELEAIAGARVSVNLLAYIFQKGEIADKFLEILTDRARHGVQVNLVFDAVGAMAIAKSFFNKLRDAGGRVAFFHPLTWHGWPSFNNRTHRELLIVDGKVGFIGGAGIADHWLHGKHGHPPWRDTMFRVEGSIVGNLQSAFCENWLESVGEILMGEEHFPFPDGASGSPAMVVISSPTSGGSTRARILFQALLASARKSIAICTPYFLPDASVRSELIRAVRERNVQVRIVTPGKASDHVLTRSSSRRLYGELLRAGIRIFEYQPAMIHAKILIVDDLWSVGGSTNFDHRSFGLNDEINLAVFDPRVARRLGVDFEADLAASREVTLEQWRSRPLLDRLQEPLGWALTREQ
jgi:cardiolipin synthase A/B